MGEKWIADLGNGYYKNPVLFADYSDPDIIRTDTGFFMIASSFTYFPGLPVLYSKDLVNWRVVSYAVRKLPFSCYDVPQHGKGIWAPSIRYNNGFFMIYFATPDEGIFMTKTKEPFGVWDDVVLVKEGKGLIDPCPLWDDDGRAYLVHAFARSRAGIKSILRVFEMTVDGTRLLGDGKTVYDGRIHNPTIEGPKFYKKNGFYYIFAPAGGVTNGWQTVLRSENIYGPYEYRIAMRQNDTQVNGPHQGGLVELPGGKSFFLHFQDAGGYGRITHLQPVNWVSDWPVIGNYNRKYNTGEPVSEYKKPIDSAGIIIPETSDDFSSERLGLQWQWQAHENKRNYELKGDCLRLFSSGIPSGTGLLCDAPAILTQLIQSPDFSVTAEINDFLKMSGDCAGICITGGNYYSVRLQNVDGKVYIVNSYFEYKDCGEPMEETVSDVLQAVPGEKIFFKIDVRYNMMMRFYYSYDGEYYFELGEEMKYLVDRRSWVGGRIGLFCINLKQEDSEGFADFIDIDVS